ncbi:hypothetical protein [Methanosarcina sp. WWM596]|uniref:hypothetical protein n=1 Tax=Methanosarcina sp. WWM596 TaxID=1434103 RepID=UPI0006154A11|nr:hypothetical protein [Methanosarcina sp. WWM596]AKB19009.1 hypothetical protein MSWHS_2146 [Methanosarcina sp. WWM596]
MLDFIQIGPGLPPSKSMPKWYIPGAWQGNAHSCTSSFPTISPYCKVGKFSDGRFISVWYFDAESEFLKGEDTLYRYLEENGDVFQQELNISTELQDEIERREVENFPNFTFFNSTGYESPETSGYFLVYKRPFLKGREDYFIAYYGILGTINLTEETPALKKLIAESYYMSNEEGKVDGLKKEDKKGKGNSLLPWF